MGTMETLRLTFPAAEAGALPRRLVHAAIALAIGAGLLWSAGFSENAALHDTAHDTRHALGFPCH